MESVSDKISQLYIETFTLEKVRADLFEHLRMNTADLFVRIDSGYVLYADFEYEEDKYEKVTITDDDKITIIHYLSYCDLREDVGFTVIIGIGKFDEGKKFDLFKIEKCLAKLRYNPDLSMYDVEFYINEN
jgi:hypothetical protein